MAYGIQQFLRNKEEQKTKYEFGGILEKHITKSFIKNIFAFLNFSNFQNVILNIMQIF